MSETIHYNLYNDDARHNMFEAFIDKAPNKGRASFVMHSETLSYPFSIEVPFERVFIYKDDRSSKTYLRYEVDHDGKKDDVADFICKLPKLDEAMCAMQCFSKMISYFYFIIKDENLIKDVKEGHVGSSVLLNFAFEDGELVVKVNPPTVSSSATANYDFDRNGIAHFYVLAFATDPYTSEKISFLFTNNHLVTTKDEPNVLSKWHNNFDSSVDYFEADQFSIRHEGLPKVCPRGISGAFDDEPFAIRFEVNELKKKFYCSKSDKNKINSFCCQMLRSSHFANNDLKFFNLVSLRERQFQFILDKIRSNSDDVVYELIPEKLVNLDGALCTRWPVARPKSGIYSIVCNFENFGNKIIFTEVLPNSFVEMLLKDPFDVDAPSLPKENDHGKSLNIMGTFKIRRYGTTSTLIKC